MIRGPTLSKVKLLVPEAGAPVPQRTDIPRRLVKERDIHVQIGGKIAESRNVTVVICIEYKPQRDVLTLRTHCRCDIADDDIPITLIRDISTVVRAPMLLRRASVQGDAKIIYAGSNLW